MSQAKFYLLFDCIRIQAANAISGPLSYGFPALNGFLGAIHALNRRLPESDGVTLGGVLVACHECDVQMYHRPHTFAYATFKQSRNPLNKDAEAAPIIEEGKVHLTVSLLIEVSKADQAWANLSQNPQSAWCEQVRTLLMQQRIAGGSVTHIGDVQLFEPHQQDEMIAALLPAFVLMDAGQDLIAITRELQTGQQHLVDVFNEIQPAYDEDGAVLPTPQAAQAQATALDALIEVATLHHLPPKNKDSKDGKDDKDSKDDKEWRTHSVKSGRGWLVPLPVGYQGIAPPFTAGKLSDCRTPDYPSQYVETIYSLGKWVFPFRLPENFEQCFWRYAAPQDNLYLITQATFN